MRDRIVELRHKSFYFRQVLVRDSWEIMMLNMITPVKQHVVDGPVV
jgi:hypothetical protein